MLRLLRQIRFGKHRVDIRFTTARQTLMRRNPFANRPFERFAAKRHRTDEQRLPTGQNNRRRIHLA